MSSGSASDAEEHEPHPKTAHTKSEEQKDDADADGNAIGDDPHPPYVAVVALVQKPADRAVSMRLVPTDEERSLCRSEDSACSSRGVWPSMPLRGRCGSLHLGRRAWLRRGCADRSAVEQEICRYFDGHGWPRRPRRRRWLRPCQHHIRWIRIVSHDEHLTHHHEGGEGESQAYGKRHAQSADTPFSRRCALVQQRAIRIGAQREDRRERCAMLAGHGQGDR